MLRMRFVCASLVLVSCEGSWSRMRRLVSSANFTSRTLASCGKSSVETAYAWMSFGKEVILGVCVRRWM